jgi:uncharacterized membrane protein YfcA
MMEGMAFWMAAVAASVFVGLSKGGLPVVASLGVPVLALVIHPVAAAGLLLPVYVASDVVGVWTYRRRFSRKLLLILIPPALLGITLGWATAAMVQEWMVKLLIGLIGLLSALNLLLRRRLQGPPRDPPVPAGLFWGLVIGFTSFVSHSGAPPFQVYVLPLRLEKLTFAGTATITFAIVNAAKLIPYYALGQLSPDNLRVAAFLMLPASLAVLAGARLVRILPEKLFFQFVTWTLLAVSLKLLWDALRGT